MEYTFTQNLLIKLLYREVSRGESLQLQTLFASESAAVKSYRDLKQTKRLLSGEGRNVSGSAIRKILAYSKETAVKEKV